jgi:hypothetical protein
VGGALGGSSGSRLDFGGAALGESRRVKGSAGTGREQSMLRTSIAALVVTATLAVAGSAAAAGPSNPNANCTAGFAYGAGGQAVASVAQPPKQFGSLSDVGYYSRTDCS